jgi:hypothetical protein
MPWVCGHEGKPTLANVSAAFAALPRSERHGEGWVVCWAGYGHTDGYFADEDGIVRAWYVPGSDLGAEARAAAAVRAMRQAALHAGWLVVEVVSPAGPVLFIGEPAPGWEHAGPPPTATRPPLTVWGPVP